MRITRAIILAAGRGTRMKALTDDRPKCLVELRGKPLLQWQLDALNGGGIKDILVVRGYNGHMLEGPFSTLDNADWANSNMVTTLTKADKWLREGPTLISYSDIVYRPEHVQTLASSSGFFSMTYDTCWSQLWKLRFDDPLSDAETFVQRDGFLQDIGDKVKRLDDVHGQYMGLLKITPAVWRTIHNYLESLGPEKVAKLDVTALLKALLGMDVSIQTVPVAGGWCEVDSDDDLNKYEKCMSQADNGKPWTHDFRKP